MNLAEFEKKIKNETRCVLKFKTIGLSPKVSTCYEHKMSLTFIDTMGYKVEISKIITTSRLSGIDFNNIYIHLTVGENRLIK